MHYRSIIGITSNNLNAHRFNAENKRRHFFVHSSIRMLQIKLLCLRDRILELTRLSFDFEQMLIFINFAHFSQKHIIGLTIFV